MVDSENEWAAEKRQMEKNVKEMLQLGFELDESLDALVLHDNLLKPAVHNLIHEGNENNVTLSHSQVAAAAVAAGCGDRRAGSGPAAAVTEDASSHSGERGGRRGKNHTPEHNHRLGKEGNRGFLDTGELLMDVFSPSFPSHPRACGFIFCCSGKTYEESISTGVLAMPGKMFGALSRALAYDADGWKHLDDDEDDGDTYPSHTDTVQGRRKGGRRGREGSRKDPVGNSSSDLPSTFIFLWNFTERTLHGPFQALEPPGLYILPEAFIDANVYSAHEERIKKMRGAEKLVANAFLETDLGSTYDRELKRQYGKKKKSKFGAQVRVSFYQNVDNGEPLQCFPVDLSHQSIPEEYVKATRFNNAKLRSGPINRQQTLALLSLFRALPYESDEGEEHEDEEEMEEEAGEGEGWHGGGRGKGLRGGWRKERDDEDDDDDEKRRTGGGGPGAAGDQFRGVKGKKIIPGRDESVTRLSKTQITVDSLISENTDFRNGYIFHCNDKTFGQCVRLGLFCSTNKNIGRMKDAITYYQGSHHHNYNNINNKNNKNKNSNSTSGTSKQKDSLGNYSSDRNHTTIIFLYNFQSRVLYGFFEAVGMPKLNILPQFLTKSSPFDKGNEHPRGTLTEFISFFYLNSSFLRCTVLLYERHSYFLYRGRS